MPTKNPKISAYVPQHLYDLIVKFKAERNLTMSQAAITIFAEYFGVDKQKKEIEAAVIEELRLEIINLKQRVLDLEQFRATFKETKGTVTDKSSDLVRVEEQENFEVKQSKQKSIVNNNLQLSLLDRDSI